MKRLLLGVAGSFLARMTPLCELAKKYGTDKYEPHNYTPVYWRLLHERADRVRKVLEIGIAEGAKSLRMWEEFFPNANIIGVDVDGRWLLNEGRIKSFKLDQTSRSEMYQLGRHYGKFDIIVEDGNHNPKAQVAAMDVLLRWVADDGFYFMEDIWIDPDLMGRNVPPGFAYEFHESEKKIESGLRHFMMVVTRQ